jgi:hypothetical protein
MEVDDAHVRHEHASVGRRTGVPWGHEVNMRSTKPITSAPFPLHVGAWQRSHRCRPWHRWESAAGGGRHVMRDELAACSPASPRAQPGQREAWVMWPFDWALLPSGTRRRGCLACLVGLHTGVVLRKTRWRVQGSLQSNDLPEKASSSQFIQPYVIALL